MELTEDVECISSLKLCCASACPLMFGAVTFLIELCWMLYLQIFTANGSCFRSSLITIMEYKHTTFFLPLTTVDKHWMITSSCSMKAVWTSSWKQQYNSLGGEAVQTEIIQAFILMVFLAQMLMLIKTFGYSILESCQSGSISVTVQQIQYSLWLCVGMHGLAYTLINLRASPNRDYPSLQFLSLALKYFVHQNI